MYRQALFLKLLLTSPCIEKEGLPPLSVSMLRVATVFPVFVLLSSVEVCRLRET